MASICPICCDVANGETHEITAEIQNFYELDDHWVGKIICHDHYVEYTGEMGIPVTETSTQPLEGATDVQGPEKSEPVLEIPAEETTQVVEEHRRKAPPPPDIIQDLTPVQPQSEAQETHPGEEPALSSNPVDEQSQISAPRMVEKEELVVDDSSSNILGDQRTSRAFVGFKVGEDKKLAELERRRAETSLNKLRKGGLFIKYRYGKGQKRYVWLDEKRSTICWGKKFGKELNSASTSEVVSVSRERGEEWGGFKRKGKKEALGIPEEEKCISIICKDRSLDLVCPSVRERELWYDAFEFYIRRLRQH